MLTEKNVMALQNGPMALMTMYSRAYHLPCLGIGVPYDRVKRSNQYIRVEMILNKRLRLRMICIFSIERIK